EYFATNSFGPFVNRNHFAGWMLLLLAVTLGALFAQLQQMVLPRNPRLRDRLLWLGSPAGTPALLTAAAALVMTCSLLWTMSRSGMAAAGVVVGVMCLAATRRLSTGLQRGVAAASLVAALVGA